MERFDEQTLPTFVQGVNVYVLLYSEMSIALKLNSQHTARVLTDLHSNIHVIRHPFLRPFSWYLALANQKKNLHSP